MVLKVCSIINLVVFILVVVFHNFLPPVIPLFYGNPSGEGQLVGSWMLTLPSLLSLGFIALNFIVVQKTKNSFLNKAVDGLAIVFTLLSSIAVLKIFFLVGSI